MKDKPKTSIFKKLFGQSSCCCSFEVEENDKEEDKGSDKKNGLSFPNCCSNETDPDDSNLRKSGTEKCNVKTE